MSKIFYSIATVAAGLTLGASLLQADSAQAASFFDLNIQWDNNTTTTGWLEVDDTPENQGSVAGLYDYESWNWSSLLNASFTHDGTTYGKFDFTGIYLSHYNFPANSSVLPYWGNVLSTLNLSFDGQSINAGDSGDGAINPDYGYEYNNGRYTQSATSVSITKRAPVVTPDPNPVAVPEPATLAGLTLAGAAIAATRRKQQRKTVD